MHSNPWRSWLAIGAVCFLSAAATGAGETYDLRGPATRKGQVYRIRSVFTMKNGDFAVTVGGMTLNGKMDMTTTSEKEEEVLGVEGRQVVKMRTRILKDESVIKTDLGGMKQEKTEKKALQGQTVLSQQTKEGWTHKIGEVQPSEKQLKELKSYNEPLPDDDLYPAEKVKVGHTWKVDANALKKVLGSKVTKIAGQGKSKFLRVEKVGDDECAVIETELDITATLKEDNNDLNLEMKGKYINHRSLKTGLDRKSQVEARATYSGTIEEGGMKVAMKFSGKVTGDDTKELKKP